MTEENRIYIHELYKVVNPTSILVVDQFKTVKRLHCPFRVIALDDIPPDIITGNFYHVDFVKMSLVNLKEVYIINGKGYYIKHFQII